MTPNLTVSYMAEQVNRVRLDGVAARGWLAEQAAANCSNSTGPATAPLILGAALIRLREWIRGAVRPARTLTDPAAFSVH